MSASQKHLRELMDKIDALSPERVEEVEDFVDFLRQKDQDQKLTQSARNAAEPSLKKVWDNPDDAVYDAL